MLGLYDMFNIGITIGGLFDVDRFFIFEWCAIYI